MNINYHILENSIILNYEGKTTNIHKSDGRYREVIECIKEDRLEDIPEIVDVEKSFNRMGLTLVDGIINIDGEPLPNALSRKVLAIRDLGLPTNSLLNFWENLKKNPSLNSREMLYKFLEHNGHPITEDGHFIAYRGVTGDFMDPHTRTFDNSVGSVCEMPRSEVDDNPNNTCSRGLHVACFDYAHSFSEQVVEVKVNPADVVCVPQDYKGTKMRVCRFEVVSVCESMRDEEVYGNTAIPPVDLIDDEYEITDQEWIDIANEYGLTSDNDDEEGWW